jgi:predicted DCC family thiol-disulfide oxidoreductase YuxK
VGADAFEVLWRRTDGQERWARLMALPVAGTLARWVYNVFAVLLYRWNRLRKRW